MPPDARGSRRAPAVRPEEYPAAGELKLENKKERPDKMKRLIVLFALLAFAWSASGQVMDPVSWSASAEKTADGQYVLKARAVIDAPWHIYALVLPEGGPFPTEFEFAGAGDSYILEGKMTEPKPEKVYDKNFRMEIEWHSGAAVFSQKIKVTGGPLAQITADVTYMACNDEQCLAPETKTLTFRLEGGAAFTAAPGEKPVDPKLLTGPGPVIPASKTDSASAGDPMHSKGYGQNAQGGKKLPLGHGPAIPGEKVAEKMMADTSKTVEDVTLAADTAVVKIIGGSDGTTEILVADGTTGTSSSGLLGTFLFAFVAGLLALLTPCVFPMIPMTVSFFMKRYSDRKKGIRDAVLYGFSIIAIYLILGVGVSAIFGASALNAMSTDPWFNIFFFLLLVVFAASFFGAFELTLPSSWVNRMDRKSDKAGLVGIFFMAFTLALVSFSCTGPFVGTILVEAAAKGNFWGPVVGMAGFSVALALPFTLFALFPGWLSGLPKSGGWLNSVKVVLGFIELAFALKFLSNADMVLDWHLLEREVFIALWVVIFALLGFYLLGKIRLPHDSPMEKISVIRLFLAIITLSFALYMVPGIWGAPVKIISAFAPPTTYSESPNGLQGALPAFSMAQPADYFAHVTDRGVSSALPVPHQGPQGIPVFTDLEEATVYAKAVNRPILLDFTGKACVNCRKMEADVWSDPRVKQLLSDDFVVVELYVDFREKLPESQQFVTAEGKKIKTVGQKWTDYQIKRFGSNSQPYYVITDIHDKVIAPTRAYDTDVQAYINWLEAAKAAFAAGK